ncbi:hypothetical protein SAMN05443572_103253 [Myxococcus fulvus]|uniref:Uncharacterized protein n=1 Tax=Myxococcus fulvus TaxID=33 RepID=A0A511T8S7_MYXFU|nr:hypothetical protein [Myxococcus fulvus]GEN10576.1 hypothetical protein MFU01_56130 [Myxococcus fulvus]SET79451.1 hypothetical protein SAMN05443572_103253 [Myxococcus fulvus]
MHLSYLLPILLTFTACDLRSKEERLQEMERVQLCERTSKIIKTFHVEWVATGKHHTTLLYVEPFAGSNEQELRATMEWALVTRVEGTRPALEKAGWLRVGLRDRATGIELTIPVSDVPDARPYELLSPEERERMLEQHVSLPRPSSPIRQGQQGVGE